MGPAANCAEDRVSVPFSRNVPTPPWSTRYTTTSSTGSPFTGAEAHVVRADCKLASVQSPSTSSAKPFPSRSRPVSDDRYSIVSFVYPW